MGVPKQEPRRADAHLWPTGRDFHDTAPRLPYSFIELGVKEPDKPVDLVQATRRMGSSGPAYKKGCWRLSPREEPVPRASLPDSAP